MRLWSSGDLNGAGLCKRAVGVCYWMGHMSPED